MRKQGLSLLRIAEEVGCALNTVRRHLSAENRLRYERKVKRARKVEPFESYVRQRQEQALPDWIPATVLHREIAEQGYAGGLSQLRAYLRTLCPVAAVEPLVRFETEPGEQMQADWVEFRNSADPLYAFCATLGYSRMSYVKFVTDMKVGTLIACHQRAFEAFGGVPKRILYDNMKTIVIERDAYGEGEHRYHSGFLDYARHCGFVIKLYRPYRAKTKGKVERFNGYLRRSFYIPLAAKLKACGLTPDASTANREVTRWLREVANCRIHGTTELQSVQRLKEELPFLQPLAAPWRGDIGAARPHTERTVCQPETTRVRPAIVAERIEQAVPPQHPLTVYAQLLDKVVQAQAVLP